MMSAIVSGSNGFCGELHTHRRPMSFQQLANLCYSQGSEFMDDPMRE